MKHVTRVTNPSEIRDIRLLNKQFHYIYTVPKNKTSSEKTLGLYSLQAKTKKLN